MKLKVQKNYSIYLPIKVCELKGIKPGSILDLSEEDGKLILELVK